MSRKRKAGSIAKARAASLKAWRVRRRMQMDETERKRVIEEYVTFLRNQPRTIDLIPKVTWP